MSIAGKWGYTTDSENYHGAYDSPEEASREGDSHLVGQYRDPLPPEDCLCNVDSLFGQIWDHEDYSGEWAEDSLSCSREQEEELLRDVKEVFGRWLDRHDLRPKFGIVEKELEITDVIDEM